MNKKDTLFKIDETSDGIKNKSAREILAKEMKDHGVILTYA